MQAIGRERNVDPKRIEIWFADEARVGQKNKITRRWAKRGTRPSAPKDQRTASAYIFGAICPKQGKGAGLVLPHCAQCDRLQYPPQQACQFCNSAAGLTWKEVEGRGHIATSIVIEDGRLNRRMPDQPYNLAMVTLDADPRVNFYSNLPGTPPYQVPVGAAVEVTFEEVAPGQLIHEWRVVA